MSDCLPLFAACGQVPISERPQDRESADLMIDAGNTKESEAGNAPAVSSCVVEPDLVPMPALGGCGEAMALLDA